MAKRAFSISGLIVALALVFAAPSGAVASEGATEQTDSISPVFAFNRLCYTQMPFVGPVRDMAMQFGWKPLSGEELAPFSRVEGGSLEGWDIQFGEEFYRLGVSQGPVSEVLASQFPDFANGGTTLCSLVLGDGHDAESVMAEMQALAGKEPATANVDDGAVLTTTWSGGNQDFKVFLVNKVSKTGDGGILHVTLISRE